MNIETLKSIISRDLSWGLWHQLSKFHFSILPHLFSLRTAILGFNMAPAAHADLFGGSTPVWEHLTKQASVVQASVLTGPKQLHLVGVLFGNFIGSELQRHWRRWSQFKIPMLITRTTRSIGQFQNPHRASCRFLCVRQESAEATLATTRSSEMEICRPSCR